MASKSLTGLLLAGLARPALAQPAAEEPQCGLYLAPSSRPKKDADQPNDWGIYAGRTFRPEDAIGSPDVATNVHAFAAHNTLDEDDDTTDAAEAQFLALLAEALVQNLWQPSMVGAEFELEAEDGGTAAVWVPGPGMLADYNTEFPNVEFDSRAGYQRVTVGDAPGRASPGRGASSPFYSLVFRATDDISVGEELILNFSVDDSSGGAVAAVGQYGEVNPETAILEEDYTRIDQTIDQMIEFFEKHKESVDEEGQMQIYRFMTDDFMEAAVGPAKAKLIAALLPEHPRNLTAIKAEGGSKKYSIKLQKLKQGQRIKTMEWLQANGMCMDNIRSGPSTIPHAGRGAFANRKIPKGGLVAPNPLFIVPDKVSMNMYDLDEDDDGTMYRDGDQRLRGQQLLVNYMYSHPKSTMGFIPTGANVNLINHSDKPNAKMQWSSHPMHVKDYLTLSPVELMNYQPMGAVMEIVALRNIEEGEEIFIDYGKNWQEAWNRHVQAFQEKGIDTWPLRASDLNARLTREPIRTDEEQEDEPYPEGVMLKVFALAGGDRTLVDGSEEYPFEFTEPESGTLYNSEVLVDAEILEREEPDEENGDDDEFTYTIRYRDTKNGGYVYVTDVPQHAFTFVDEPGMGDQFVPSVRAFRHFIEIPDDVFPSGPWRNQA